MHLNIPLLTVNNSKYWINGTFSSATVWCLQRISDHLQLPSCSLYLAQIKEEILSNVLGMNWRSPAKIQAVWGKTIERPKIQQKTCTLSLSSGICHDIKSRTGFVMFPQKSVFKITQFFLDFPVIKIELPWPNKYKPQMWPLTRKRTLTDIRFETDSRS